ncbi:MAG: tRNA-guanine transglycosylase DpdA [Thermoplasmatales archaeon]|nr:tRNA-guanine transglycosylase DpdA [Thermoplasmatales archaeon]
MKFFLPDWEDRVDPGFSFEKDKFSEKHETDPYSNDMYAHQLFSPSLPYDGILVSLSIFQSKLKLKDHGSNEILIRHSKQIKDYLKIPKKSSLEVLGDCGAFSYVSKKDPPDFFSSENVANIYDKLGFDYGVSVDHMALSSYMIKDKETGKRKQVPISQSERERRVRITLKNAKDFLDIHKEKGYKFKPIGAAQGYDRKSYVKSVKELVGMGYDYIGIGSLVRHSSKEILSILEEIEPELEGAWLHLFGVLRPSYLTKFEDLGVVSFDSASYLRKAWLRSGQNYLTSDNEWYAAIRVPYSDNTTIRKSSKKRGISIEQLVSLERRAIQSLKMYESGQASIERTLRTVVKYDSLLTRNSSDGSNLQERYRRTLDDKPWKKCNCEVCKEMGIDVLIFRGSNRNKRRGFHNSWVFNNILKDSTKNPSTKGKYKINYTSIV